MMNPFRTWIFLVPLVAWFCSHLWKFTLKSYQTKKLAWGEWMMSGGMPSSHSAIVTSLATAIGMTEGLTSPLFAIVLTHASIVMHDARGIRQHAGNHAKMLNILLEILKPDVPALAKIQSLKEAIGHRTIEVLVGALLGIAIATILLSISFFDILL